ncbi:MAG: DUF3592 domain-containing protein [Polyangiaceae bacterium]
MKAGALVGILFGVGIALIFLVVELLAVRPYFEAKSWSETQCSVQGARLVEDNESDSFNVIVYWSYEVGGTTYQLEDDPEIFGLAYDEDEGRAAMATYVSGSVIPCWYDPAEPRRATLDRTPPPSSFWVMVVGTVLAVLGGLGAFLVVLLRSRRA